MSRLADVRKRIKKLGFEPYVVALDAGFCGWRIQLKGGIPDALRLRVYAACGVGVSGTRCLVRQAPPRKKARKAQRNGRYGGRAA